LAIDEGDEEEAREGEEIILSGTEERTRKEEMMS